MYASLDARKLAGFLDVEEEEMVCALMVLKNSGRGICRVGEDATSKGEEKETSAPSIGGGSPLDGQMITTSDFDFVISEVSRVHFTKQSCELTGEFPNRI